MENKFERVALSGGGVKGLVQLGVLHYFFEKGLYNPQKVDTYTGTSIGSAICLLLTCGYTPMEIFSKIYLTSRFFEPPEDQSVWNILEKSGLLPIEAFTSTIEEMIFEKMEGSPTLLELKEKTGKTLIIASANVTKEKIDYFSYKNHPGLEALEAVRLSCNLPVLCYKREYKGNFYVDGGMIDSFPIKQIDDGQVPILGVVVLGKDASFGKGTFPGYIYRLINMPINAITKLRCQGLGENVTLVKIDCGDVPLLQFSMTSETKMDLFLQGYYEANIVSRYEKLTVRGWSEEWDFSWNPFKDES